MAPPSNQKRVKGVQIFRPFIYGTTAKLFSESNPKPPGTPVDHTHSWTVFVKGVDDTDITYWCKKVQFKLHESIPNPLRNVEDVPPGGAFEVHETGWGEFEITIKFYYVAEANEKAQTIYHHLRLHPYGETEEEKEKMRQGPDIKAWVYEEMLFNEPYEQFYDILTTPVERVKGGKSNTRTLKGGMVSSVGERTALIPKFATPDQPFSREAENQDIAKLKDAQAKVKEMTEELKKELKERQEELERLQKG